MSQERLAEVLGVTFQQVQKYEKGTNRMAASRLFDIANALDLQLPKLFDGLGTSRAGSSSQASDKDIEAALATPEGSELMRLFASIKDKKNRRRVVEFVRSLA